MAIAERDDDRSTQLNAITLKAEAAHAVRACVAEPAAKFALARRAPRAAGQTYRIDLTPEQWKQVQEGTLRFANQSKGDATVRMYDVAQKKTATEAVLKRVEGPTAGKQMTKVLGPAAWEALAMATQQHYLIEISDKLSGIAANVEEVLERLDDDKRGTLEHVAKTVADSKARLAELGSLSSGRVEELREAARDADRVWHQLRVRFRRHLTGYGEGETSRDEVECSWEMLVHATRVLSESSALLTSLPLASVEELENTAFEERERVLDAINDLQELAYELAAWHLEFQGKWVEWEAYGSRNPVLRKYREARGLPSAVEPEVDVLSAVVAQQAARIALPATPPEAIFITTQDDGGVTVAAHAGI